MNARVLELKLHQVSRILEITFDDNTTFKLPCEYLRVFSPSAEVRGHGPGQENWPVSKEQVNINQIEPVGHYGVKLIFDDGHDSGIYSWQFLYELGQNQEQNWHKYQTQLKPKTTQYYPA